MGVYPVLEGEQGTNLTPWSLKDMTPPLSSLTISKQVSLPFSYQGGKELSIQAEQLIAIAKEKESLSSSIV